MNKFSISVLNSEFFSFVCLSNQKVFQGSNMSEEKKETVVIEKKEEEPKIEKVEEEPKIEKKKKKEKKKKTGLQQNTPPDIPVAKLFPSKDW